MKNKSHWAHSLHLDGVDAHDVLEQTVFALVQVIAHLRKDFKKFSHFSFLNCLYDKVSIFSKEKETAALASLIVFLPSVGLEYLVSVVPGIQ